jgi:hypothetical protein
MGIFGRRDDDDTGREPAAPPPPPPHPALASADAFLAAPLPEAAAALLLLVLADEQPGASVEGGRMMADIRATFGAPEGTDGIKLFQQRNLQPVVDEAFGLLERSLLITRSWIGNNHPYVSLTRRGRQALDGGDPVAWMDLPRTP